MGKPNYGGSNNNSNKDLAEGFMEVLGGLARGVSIVGGGIAVIAFALLVWYIYTFGSGTPTADQTQLALNNIKYAQMALALGLIGFGVGTAFRWWGETHLPITHAIVAFVVAGGPFYMPLLFGESQNPVPAIAMRSMQAGGTVFVLMAAIILIVDIYIRVRDRFTYGMKADQLKFGKGVKEEMDHKVVFMGKCWQLPYCRKFVRERCPIYHSGRTCWKERTGCMCEEEVIRNAMEGKVISRDQLKAAAMIPRNNRLTMAQKAARCRQCVIYNEHQKQKYKVWLVLTNLICVGVAAILWIPMNFLLNSAVRKIDEIVGHATVTGHSDFSGMLATNSFPFVSILTFSLMLIGFTYALKVLEFLIFKVKI